MTDWHPDYFKKLVKEAIRELQQEDRPLFNSDKTLADARQKSIDILRKHQEREFEEADSVLRQYHARKAKKNKDD